MATRKQAYLEQLAKYFISKGKILTEKEYKEARDTPIRFFFIKRKIGNWKKMEVLLKKNHPDVYEVINKPNPVKQEPKPVPKPVPIIKKVEPKEFVKNEK